MAKKRVELDGLDFGGATPPEPKEQAQTSVAAVIKPSTQSKGVRRINATLRTQDAIRFKRAAEDNGYKMHDAIVTAINRLMAEWQEPAVTNVGSTYKNNSK